MFFDEVEPFGFASDDQTFPFVLEAAGVGEMGVFGFEREDEKEEGEGEKKKKDYEEFMIEICGFRG